MYLIDVHALYSDFDIPEYDGRYFLFWSIRGVGGLITASGNYEIIPGQLFIVNPGALVKILKWPEEGWLICFDSWLMRRFFEQYPSNRWLGMFHLHNLKPFTEISSKSWENLNGLATVLNKDKTTGSALQSTILNAVLLLITDNYRSHNDMTYGHIYVTGIEKLFNLIDQFYQTKHRTHFYAKELGISPRKLNQKAKIATGKLVETLIDEKILSVSEELLSSTDKPLKEIAYQLGFTSSSHFSRFFRQYKNINPMQFRQNVQEHDLNGTKL